MTIFPRIIRRRSSDDDVTVAGPEPAGVAKATSTDQGQLPFAGYDRLGTKDLVARLAEHSQPMSTPPVAGTDGAKKGGGP